MAVDETRIQVGMEPDNPNPATNQENKPTAFDKKTGRFILLLTGAAGVLLLLHFTPFGAMLKDINRFKAQLETGGIWPELSFFVLSSIAIATGAPRLAFYGVAGIVFGFWEGLFLAHSAALTGSWFTYRFVRWSGRSRAQKKLADYPALRRILTSCSSVQAVVILRQLPVPGMVVNAGLGLSPVRSRIFLLGSLIGFLPQGIMMLLIGDSFAEENPKFAALQFALAIVLAFAALTGIMIKKRNSGN